MFKVLTGKSFIFIVDELDSVVLGVSIKYIILVELASISFPAFLLSSSKS
jgi:hypothetical protein